MPLYILLAVGALLLCGCSEKDPGEVDLPASELASAAETVPAVSTGTVVGTDKAIGLDKIASSEAPPSGPVEIFGAKFFGKDYDPPSIEANGMQILRHKGSVEAEVDLPRACSKVILKVKPRIVDGAHPVVSLLLENIGGKALHVRPIQDFPVQEKAAVEKSIAIPKGKYRVVLEYYKSSKEGVNGHLELHGVVFE